MSFCECLCELCELLFISVGIDVGVVLVVVANMDTIGNAIDEIGVVCIPVDDGDEKFETMDEERIIEVQNRTLNDDELTEVEEIDVIETDETAWIMIETDFFKD